MEESRLDGSGRNRKDFGNFNHTQVFAIEESYYTPLLVIEVGNCHGEIERFARSRTGRIDRYRGIHFSLHLIGESSRPLPRSYRINALAMGDAVDPRRKAGWIYERFQTANGTYPSLLHDVTRNFRLPNRPGCETQQPGCPAPRQALECVT